MGKFKSIEWAYPTSTNAKKFGHHDSGCFVVQLTKGIIPPKAVAGYTTRERASEHAKAMPEKWSNLFLRNNPEFTNK